MTYEYTLIRSKRQTLSLEISKDEKIIVRSPLYTSQRTIDAFVEGHSDWIASHLERVKARNEKKSSLSSDDIEILRQRAKNILPDKVEYYSNLMGLYPVSVKITSAKTRFGSCSARNGICFSLYLMQYPESFIDYVVVHELCHIRYKNHGKYFHALIERYIPEHRKIEKQKYSII